MTSSGVSIVPSFSKTNSSNSTVSSVRSSHSISLVDNKVQAVPRTLLPARDYDRNRPHCFLPHSNHRRVITTQDGRRNSMSAMDWQTPTARVRDPPLVPPLLPERPTVNTNNFLLPYRRVNLLAPPSCETSVKSHGTKPPVRRVCTSKRKRGCLQTRTSRDTSHSAHIHVWETLCLNVTA